VAAAAVIGLKMTMKNLGLASGKESARMESHRVVR
jgi:hypothetical protein